MRSRLFVYLISVTFIAATVATGNSDVLTVPEPISFPFQLDKTTVEKALAELTLRSHCPVDYRTVGAGTGISLNLPQTTFWPALDAIAKATNSRVELYARDGRLALVPRASGHGDPPLSYSGFFRSALSRITSSRDLETGASTCTARLEIAWEPTLEPLFLETSPQSLRVQDDHGRDLPTKPEGSVVAPVEERLALAIDIPLPSVPRSVRRLGLVEGKLSAIAPGKILDFRFDTLDRLAEVSADSPLRRRELDGVTCRLSKLQLMPDRWTIQVTLEYPRRGVRLESYQSGIGINELIVVAKDNSKRLARDGYVVETATDRTTVITYHFLDSNRSTRGSAANWKVRYRAPAYLVEVPLTFSFKDVALP